MSSPRPRDAKSSASASTVEAKAEFDVVEALADLLELQDQYITLFSEKQSTDALTVGELNKYRKPMIEPESRFKSVEIIEKMSLEKEFTEISRRLRYFEEKMSETSRNASAKDNAIAQNKSRGIEPTASDRQTQKAYQDNAMYLSQVALSLATLQRAVEKFRAEKSDKKINSFNETFKNFVIEHVADLERRGSKGKGTTVIIEGRDDSVKISTTLANSFNVATTGKVTPEAKETFSKASEKTDYINERCEGYKTKRTMPGIGKKYSDMDLESLAKINISAAVEKAVVDANKDPKKLEAFLKIIEPFCIKTIKAATHQQAEVATQAKMETEAKAKEDKIEGIASKNQSLVDAHKVILEKFKPYKERASDRTDMNALRRFEVLISDAQQFDTKPTSIKDRIEALDVHIKNLEKLEKATAGTDKYNAATYTVKDLCEVCGEAIKNAKELRSGYLRIQEHEQHEHEAGKIIKKTGFFGKVFSRGGAGAVAEIKTERRRSPSPSQHNDD